MANEYRNAGDLTTRVELLRQPPLDDFHGDEDLEPVAEVWASWKPVVGNKATQWQQQFGRVSSSVLIRYRADVNCGMLLRRIDDQKIAAIRSVIPVNGGKQWLELAVDEEARHGQGS